jgi:ATP-dependent protease HslVU (ClpYQ) peptidase subunit
MNAANKDLVAHPGIARSLHVTANGLRSQYQVALAQNPSLTFGQFVAATRLAHNLGRNNRNITRDSILAGLAAGRSIGRTLQDLGLNSREAKEAKKEAEREFELSKK